MRAIQMVDVRQQYLRIKPEIDAALLNVLDTSVFIGGPYVNDFAANLASYLGVKHIIPCANGTDALQIVMMALGLKPGDEIITPSFTFIATAEVIALLQLVPVFVDVDRSTFCIDPQAIRGAITPKTKAIVPVHLFGQAAYMEEIMAIADEHNLFVIEDNAQTIGADYTFSDGTIKKTGAIGHVSCTSFFPSKNLGCYGDGGAMCTNDDALANKLKMIANHGQTKKYYHDVVGCNSRLDAMQAAVLNIKLPLLHEFIEARRKAADYYDDAFAGNPAITIPSRAGYCRHVFHQYTIVLNDMSRDGLCAYLADKNIPSAIYYPVPAHRQKMFSEFGSNKYQLENTDWLSQRVLSLPMHTELQEDQQLYIKNSVLDFIKN
ncbi:MAG: DegT/DnrJ/EryC1/StrS family aminotransferase [Ginsengibacter sp.]